jgi:cytochrome c oxidase subunit 2
MLGRRLTKVCTVAALVALVSCVPQPVTEQGRAAQGLYTSFTVIAAVIFSVVALLILFSIVRFRRKTDDEALPEQFHTNTKLEILWFAIPQLIVIGLFIGSVMVLDKVDATSDEPDVTVSVESFQWGWRFTYKGTDMVLESLPEEPAVVTLPTDRTIRFDLESADVIHSFYVPRFFVKRDVVPGRTNELEVMIEEAGTYAGRCAEFCGLFHDQMDFTIEAVENSEFESWLQTDQQR